MATRKPKVRRGNNEGSVYQASDGRWRGAVSLPDGRRKVVSGATRAEVDQKLTRLKADRDKGLPVALDERQTVGQFLTRWLEDTIKPERRAKTYKGYEQLVRLHIAPALGKVPLAKLTPQHVQAFITRMRTTPTARRPEGPAPRTVQYAFAVLHAALEQAAKWGLVARNVAALVDTPRIRRREVQPLSPEQARTFLESVKGDRLEALYTVALTTGMRQGEALGLRWQDVDLDGGVLRVAVALQKADRAFRLVEPKTQKSRRTLALPQATIVALRAHKVRQLEERLQLGAAWQDNGWGLVFTTSLGTPLDGSNVTHRFYRLLERAGLPRVTFHGLRHTSASLLLAQNVPPRVIMEQLGHSQISLTMNTYAHVMPVALREAADRMDAILGAR